MSVISSCKIFTFGVSVAHDHINIWVYYVGYSNEILYHAFCGSLAYYKLICRYLKLGSTIKEYLSHVLFHLQRLKWWLCLML